MIRKINENDINIINKLVKVLDKNEIISVESLKNNISNYITYIYEDKIVGFLKYTNNFESIDIDYIYVIPKFRGMGFAKQLLNYVIVKNINKKFYIEVRKSNFVAINIYEYFGFKKINERKKYYGDEDAIVYMKDDSCER